jgi:large subunit ribosomal protein L29
MKTKDLLDKSVVELNQLIQDNLEERFKLRMQMGVEQNVRTSEFPRIRRNIARIKTVIRQKTSRGA